MVALKKAWEAGYRNPIWTRQDPDLTILHGDPEFDRLYPDSNQQAVGRALFHSSEDAS